MERPCRKRHHKLIVSTFGSKVNAKVGGLALVSFFWAIWAHVTLGS